MIVYCTMKLPVIVVGWTSQRKKYVPGVDGAVNVYVVVDEVMVVPWNIAGEAALELLYSAKL